MVDLVALMSSVKWPSIILLICFNLLTMHRRNGFRFGDFTST